MTDERQIAALLRAANPVREPGDAMRVVRETDPLWQTIRAHIEHDLYPDLDERVDTPLEAHGEEAAMTTATDRDTRPTTRRKVAVWAVAAAGVAALTLGAITLLDDGRPDVVGAPAPATEPLAVVLSSPSENVRSGAVELSGPAVDQDVVCPAASFTHIAAEDGQGNPLTFSLWLREFETSTDLSWTERFTCDDGSGSFDVTYTPLIAASEVSPDEASDLARWTIDGGDGKYADLQGDGVIVVDLGRGVTQLEGEIRIP